MSKSEQQETPSADGPSHFARLGSSVTRDQGRARAGPPWSESAGATGHHGHLPAPAFSLLAITQPSLFCVAVGIRLLLVYIGDCTHSSNGFGSLSQGLSRLGRGQTQHLLAGQCRGEDNIWLANSPKIASTV